MTDMIDINVIIDENYVEPKVDIYTKSKTEQINNIIYAIENVSMNSYPPITVYEDGKMKLISQRDIYRLRTEGRNIILDTADMSYIMKGPMGKYEDELDAERFCKISQSEIINIYKVDLFDFNMAGTVSVKFDNGVVSWVARRCIKQLKDKLKNCANTNN